MGYILAYLKRLGYGGVILDDLQDRPLSLYALEMWIEKLRPIVVGFTAYQHNMDRIRFFAYYIKSNHKNITIMLGGPQAIFVPSAALGELEDVDIICRGEGETVTAEIAKCLEKNRPLSTVNGITFRDGNNIIDTPPSPSLVEDLDEFPSPYLDGLINLDGKHLAVIFSSRGCRFNCLFCISPSIGGRKLRYHSARRVLDEMEYLTANGIDRFWFADSTFPASRERALEILRGKIDRSIETPFWCETRCDLIDEEMLRKLWEAHGDTISFGLESASPEVLKNTAKGIVLSDLRRMIEIAKSIGLSVDLSCMFGLPEETIERARETLNFVQACGVKIERHTLAQQMQLYFGSVYERNRERFGFKAIPGYLPAYLSIGDRYETENLTTRDLRKIHNIWLLAFEELHQQVPNKELAFDLLNFLLSNEEDLHDEPAFYECGAIASCALEEPQLLWRFLNAYVTRLNPGTLVINQLVSKLDIYGETEAGAGPRSRVIFDGHISELDGRPFTSGMKDGYWDLTLGKNLFPISFEKGFKGVRRGEKRAFGFSLLEDYPVGKLQKTVKVSGRVHKVLNPVEVGSVDQLKTLNIQNHYEFGDLDRLLNENNVLHYLALKDFPERDLVRMPVHFLAQVYNYARLHAIQDVRRMATLVGDDKRALNGLGDVLYSAGRWLEAAYYYEQANSNESSALIKKARSLYVGGEVQKAFEALSSVPDKSSLSYHELLLDCLKIVHPRSEQIPSLDRQVLHLKVENALDNELVAERDRGTLQPIVHGATPWRRLA
jgi:anaerobic magnesium-protoporphyrin IX monomethyl ester cyclase